VDLILSDDELTNEWKSEVMGMAERLRNLRLDIVKKLKELGSTHDWSHITNQVGMFAFTGLTPEMTS
jgi:aspartate aminotransferase